MNGEILRLCLLGLILLWLIVAGRLFCGKICPVGYLQDLIYKIPFPVKIKTFKFDKYIRLVKYINVLINFLLLPVLAAFGIYYIDKNGAKAMPPTVMMFVMAVMIVIAIIIRRPICKYLCPAGAISSLFNKFSFYKYKTLNDNCVECGVCIKKCKMDIIPYKIKNSLECIRCGNCKKVCPKNAIISEFNIKIGK
jgi:polyferredoxin